MLPAVGVQVNSLCQVGGWSPSCSDVHVVIVAVCGRSIGGSSVCQCAQQFCDCLQFWLEYLLDCSVGRPGLEAPCSSAHKLKALCDDGAVDDPCHTWKTVVVSCSKFV
jgi:hypothetical protein